MVSQIEEVEGRVLGGVRGSAGQGEGFLEAGYHQRERRPVDEVGLQKRCILCMDKTTVDIGVTP